MADELLARVDTAVGGVDAEVAARAWVALDYGHVRLPELPEAPAGQVQVKLAANVLQRCHGVVERRQVPVQAVEQYEGCDILRSS